MYQRSHDVILYLGSIQVKKVENPNFFVFYPIYLKFGIGTLRKSVTLATKKRLSPIFELENFVNTLLKKLPSFKVTVFPFWSSEPFTSLKMEPLPPGANSVKWMNLDEYQGLFVCKSSSSFSHNFTAN